jgi:hypothetical protein
MNNKPSQLSGDEIASIGNNNHPGKTYFIDTFCLREEGKLKLLFRIQREEWNDAEQESKTVETRFLSPTQFAEWYEGMMKKGWEVIPKP